ncbi:MAG: calcium/sodium antiporter [Candidatus Eisenbacteria sp.]|nr:calcium/sodium antiporter [Candidatus Eisenbacteria bacterium]
MNSALILIAGLAVLLVGAEVLVRAASSLARELGVPPLVIGLTVLAFGTSAPELAVAISAACTGKTGITFGNVVGSNIANVGLIIGLTAAIRTLKVDRSIVIQEIPLMLVATALTILLASDSLFRRAPDAINRLDGILLLVGFAAFLCLGARSVSKSRQKDSSARRATREHEKRRSIHWVLTSSLVVLGLTGVLLGSHWTVAGATRVAQAVGLSQTVIGLTIVALGTSLPELTTSLMAAMRGHCDLALGNVVGSNVFNLLLVLGVSATIRTVPVPDGGRIDLLLLALFSVILLPLAVSQRKLVRTEGLVLLFGYVTYVLWRVLQPS